MIAIGRKNYLHVGSDAGGNTAAVIYTLEPPMAAAFSVLFIGEPAAWNKGFGADAIVTLVRLAFEEMNLQKLPINVYDYNDRAKHILETHGFVQEGRLRREFYREGMYHDIVILSTFRDGTPQETSS